ncbi:MAG: hypothetical protein WCC90_18130 [Methylocella sp.]
MLALIYPIATIFLIWAISDKVGPAEAALGLSPLSGWRRGLAVAAIGVSFFAFWRLRQSPVEFISVGVFAGAVSFAFAFAGAGVAAGAFALAGAVVLVREKVFTGAGTFAVVFAIVFAAAGAFALAGAVAVGVAVAGSYFGASIVAGLELRAIHALRLGRFLAIFPALMTVA